MEFGPFFLGVFRHLVVAIPGATEDVNSLSWDQLPLVPATQELLDRSCDDRKLSLTCSCCYAFHRLACLS